MLLYMQDYVNSLVALGTEHFNSSFVKRQHLSQRSKFDFSNGKHP